jgi:hypothetical protein
VTLIEATSVPSRSPPVEAAVCVYTVVNQLTGDDDPIVCWAGARLARARCAVVSR